MKKNAKEKINKIIIAIFVVLASYVFVLNILRLYNLNKTTYIEVSEVKYNEYLLERVKLKENIEKIENLNPKYYTNDEKEKIIGIFKDSYNLGEFKLNKSGKYKNILLYDYIEQIPSYPLSLSKYVLKTEKSKYTYSTLSSQSYRSLYYSSLIGSDYSALNENYGAINWNFLCSTYIKYYSDLNEYADIVLQNEGGIK